MGDLVRELRQHAMRDAYYDLAIEAELLSGAADEIERLNQVIAAHIDHANKLSGRIEKAREALRENPEIRTQWQMSRTEMLQFGWHCIRCAFSIG